MKAMIWCGCLSGLLLGLCLEAGADQVRLRSGDVLIGRVVFKNDHVVMLEHPMLGTLRLQRRKVASIAIDSKPSEDVGASAGSKPEPSSRSDGKSARTEKKKPASDSKPRPFLAGWKLSISFGLAASDRSGTDTLNANTRLSATRNRDIDRDKIQFQAFFSDREGTKAREDMHMQVQHDWLNRPDAWFTYGQADYDHDDFKHYEHRYSALCGVGFDPSLGGLSGPAFRAGLGMTGERGGFAPGDDVSLFGGEISWQVDPKNKIEFTAQAAPVFEDAITGRRLLTTADWTTKLSRSLSFRLGMRNDRDTRAPAGVAKDDRRVFGSIVFNF
ncbi:MAG: DUF481 domain-containing protein [Phycisphaeraceae bacterium]|nr:DUF481 domain-containing protein [Phycisphaeraceae bacterium]